MSAPQRDRRARLRTLGVVGAGLLALGTTLTRVHVRPLSDSWYALCWAGFILLGDALLAWRTGASLLLDRPRDAWRMVLSSAGLWWCFEAANALHLGSWSYSPSPDIPWWAQALRSTVAFATLVPAVWVAGLLGLAFTRDARESAETNSTAARWPFVAMMGVGGAFLVGAALSARFALPLGLVGVLLVVDPANHLRGRASLLEALRRGRWRVPAAFFVANVLAGVLGEAWNQPADPSWTYDVAFEAGPRLFAMPLAGYLGYGALAWVMFALYHAVRGRGTSDAVAAASPLTAAGL